MADTEIHNNPSERPSGGSSTGWVVAVLILLAVVLILLFGLPALWGGDQAAAPDNTADVNIDASIPTGGEGGAAAE